MSKYDINNKSEDGALPNKLDLTDENSINQEEFVGFASSEQEAIDELNEETLFTLDYLYQLHEDALGHLYEFAGCLRTVNMSKENFAFPSAQFLTNNMTEFQNNFLTKINSGGWNDNTELLDVLAEMHAELLYIHPFREGNGRTARVFTRIIYLAKTGRELSFEKINEKGNFKKYVAGVQQAACEEYSIMKELFRALDS